MSRSAKDFCVAAAVNDHEILGACLSRSPAIISGQIELKIYEGYSSAASALNAGLRGSTAEIVIFTHQDVYLPSGWLERLAEQIDIIEGHSPTWGVLGVFGRQASGVDVGRVWCSAARQELGAGGFPPTEVVTLDELMLVVRRASNLSFDEAIPGFHLYGTDIVLESNKAGMPAFAVDAPVVHNARPVQTLSGAYTKAYEFMRKKWWTALPLRTLICDLTRTPTTLWRAKLRRFRVRQGMTPLPPLDAVEIARTLRYE